MPIGDYFRRASSYILGADAAAASLKMGAYEDNEILFCKNNVCVHPPAQLRRVHHPGYLSITSKTFIDQHTSAQRRTLFLTWLPNAVLAQPHAAISTESLDSTASSSASSSLLGSPRPSNTNPFLMGDLTYLDLEPATTINMEISNPEIGIATTPDNDDDDSDKFEFDESVTSQDWNFTAGKNEQQMHKCRRFSVDLSQMRSLRLFFNDNSCTCGQLVVASRESQYKILHFHYGGLDHLAQVLHQWHSILHNIKQTKGYEENLPYRHFMVCRPEVSDLELHPEEGQVPKLTEDLFRSLFNEHGQLEDDLALRKSIFFSGMERSLRREVWPFLLHVYPYASTYAERSQIAEIRRLEYDEITRRRLDLAGAQLGQFRRKVQSVIEKDVVRTDRGNPFFSGDDNPNLAIMKSILLNYAIFNPGLGYTQGMSDLLAPVLCELRDEVAAFWCFVGLMQRAVFVATPTDRDMDRSLRYLRELVQLMVPKFHRHLEKHSDAGELLFCHRWILLCFKREFSEAVALRMWEACWANYLTDYFHLFLCLAIICVYADDVIAQDLRADEMLLHFSSLAMYMDGQVIARKARGLLHQFRQLREIPCTLAGLCTRCGPGIWDSSHSPRIYCSGGHDAATGAYCNNCIH